MEEYEIKSYVLKSKKVEAYLKLLRYCLISVWGGALLTVMLFDLFSEKAYGIYIYHAYILYLPAVLYLIYWYNKRKEYAELHKVENALYVGLTQEERLEKYSEIDAYRKAWGI